MKISLKKILSLFLAVCMLCSASILLMGCFDETASTTATNDNNSNDTPTADNSNQNTSLGSYDLEIKSCRLAQDYEGKPIVIVKYIFTNNDDDPTAFYLAFEDHVYQNEIGLNECYFADDSANYSEDNQTKEIKKGASIEVEVAYVLNDTTSDIEVEVNEFISLNEKKITKVFKIA